MCGSRRSLDIKRDCWSPWVRGADRRWWDKVAMSDAPGEASLQVIDGSLLTPAAEASGAAS